MQFKRISTVILSIAAMALAAKAEVVQYTCSGVLSKDTWTTMGPCASVDDVILPLTATPAGNYAGSASSCTSSFVRVTADGSCTAIFQWINGGYIKSVQIAYKVENGILYAKGVRAGYVSTTGNVYPYDFNTKTFTTQTYVNTANANGYTVKSLVISCNIDSYDTLKVGGVPREFGAVSPPYGSTRGIPAADEIQVSCPAAWTNQDATLRAVCTGWKLYDAEGGLVDSGAEDAFTYVHPSPAAYRRLEWQWQTERLRYVVDIGDVPPCYTNVSVSLSCADPDLDQGGGYFLAGARVTLSITDPDGRFSDWYGVLPRGVIPTAKTISWTVNYDSHISPRLDGWVFPDRAAAITSWYVDFSKGSNANDGHSWSTSLADFSNALARARADYTATQRKQYVFLPERPGVAQAIPKTYSITTGDPAVCFFTLDFPVVIQGAGRRENIRLSLAGYQTSDWGKKASIFKIAHAEAAMRNLTLFNMKRCKYIYPLRVHAGTFDNCIFGDNLIGSFDSLLGALVVQGGVVTNCLITGNDCYTDSGRAMNTSGIYLSGNGLVTHSVICSNACSGGVYGGGVYMVGGTLRNSLVFGHAAARTASGVYANPASSSVCLIENCTIADNVTKAGSTYTTYGLYANGSSATQKTIVRNTIVYGNSGNTAESVNNMNLYRNSATYVELYNNLSTTEFTDSATTTGNIVCDPVFADAAKGDYMPTAPAVTDSGLLQGWMASGTDLSGGPRIRGAGVDIGAYEYVTTAMLYDMLEVTGVPEEFDTVSPQYGSTVGISAGDVIQAFCPAAWTNADASLRAVCTGWKLYDAEGAVISNEAENAFTYIHPDPPAYRRLEWQWRTERLCFIVDIGDVAPCYTNVTLSLTCANPAHDQGGGYFSPGAQLTLSITDPDGRFSDWYGNLPAGVEATARTISWTVNSDCTIRPRLDGWVFPERAADVSAWYVDFETGSNENDGHSWATPLADFSNVLARARADYTATQRKQYIFVPSKPGVTQTIPKTYTISTSSQSTCYFTLDFPVVIQGAGRRENVRLGMSKYPSSTASQKAGIFKIAHNDAAMRNLTLRGMTAAKYTYPFRMTAGTLDNCIFGDNRIGSYDELLGAVVMTGGVITNCLVTGNACNCDSSRAFNTSGIYMEGGLVTHSVICSNTCSGGAYGGGVYMTGGTLRNSLVFGHEAVRNASGVYATPASGKTCLIENSTIADNVTKSGTSYTAYGLRAHGSSATQKTIVRNTIVYGNSGNTPDSVNNMNLYRNSATYVELYNNLATAAFTESAVTSGNVVGDPRFADAPGRDYRPLFSAAVDAGQMLDWMATGTDLAYGPRVRGAAVDIGAYEYVPSSELDASFGVSTLLPALDSATRLSAAAVGGTEPYSYRWIVDGVVVAEGADKAVYDYVFTGGHHTVSLVVTDAASDSVTREAPGVLTVCVPETYVAMDGSNTEPYDTPAKAARSVNDAFDLTAAGGTVHVLPGDYALGAQLKYSRANVALRSTEGPERTVLTVAPGVAAVNLASSGAVLDGITLQGFTSTAVTYFSNGGLVTNCVIRQGKAMAVYFAANGTLVDCTVAGVTNSAQILYMATEVAGSGTGTIRYCRFLDNTTTGSNWPFHFYSQGIQMRNCLFARNRSDKQQFLRFHTSRLGQGISLIESSTFVDNVGTTWASVENNNNNSRITFRNNVWFGNKTTGGAVMAIGAGGWLIANNCVVDATNYTTGTWTDIITTDDAGLKRDYAPKAGSICINHGLNQAWMETAVDLDGNPRILYKTVDVGAFERRQTGTIIQLR